MSPLRRNRIIASYFSPPHKLSPFKQNVTETKVGESALETPMFGHRHLPKSQPYEVRTPDQIWWRRQTVDVQRKRLERRARME